MPMKKHKPEQIVSLLRQIEVEMANGKTTPQACKEAEITVQTFYRWRKEYRGLKLDQKQQLIRNFALVASLAGWRWVGEVRSGIVAANLGRRR